MKVTITVPNELYDKLKEKGIKDKDIENMVKEIARKTFDSMLNYMKG